MTWTGGRGGGGGNKFQLITKGQCNVLERVLVFPIVCQAYLAVLLPPKVVAVDVAEEIGQEVELGYQLLHIRAGQLGRKLAGSGGGEGWGLEMSATSARVTEGKRVRCR